MFQTRFDRGSPTTGVPVHEGQGAHTIRNPGDIDRSSIKGTSLAIEDSCRKSHGERESPGDEQWRTIGTKQGNIDRSGTQRLEWLTSLSSSRATLTLSPDRGKFFVR